MFALRGVDPLDMVPNSYVASEECALRDNDSRRADLTELEIPLFIDRKHIGAGLYIVQSR